MKNIKFKRSTFAVAAVTLVMASSLPAMAHGWEQTETSAWTYTDINGIPKYDSWQMSNGNYYYIDSDGTMAKNKLIADGSDYYFVDENGVRVKDTWKQVIDDSDNETYWYYFMSTGKAKENGYITIDNVKYHFTDFHLDTGFSEDNKSFYGNEYSNDLYKTGWHYIADNDNVDNFTSGWYYTDEKGVLVRDQEKKINGKYYLFNSNGLMCDQWCEIVTNDGVVAKYYEKGTGARGEGWIHYDGDDEVNHGEIYQKEGYYFLENGRPFTANYKTTSIGTNLGLKKINGKTYCFDETGLMQTGVVYGDNGKIYYFGEDGVMRTGRVLLTYDEKYGYEGSYMYFDKEGSYTSGKGSDVTGVKNGYLYDCGELVKSDDGWAFIEISDGNSYVVNEDGRIKKSGTVEIDGIKYTVKSASDGGYELKTA